MPQALGESIRVASLLLGGPTTVIDPVPATGETRFTDPVNGTVLLSGVLGNSLQGAYGNGSTIDVTVAEGDVAITNTGAVATTLLSLTQGAAIANPCLEATSGALNASNAVTITANAAAGVAATAYGLEVTLTGAGNTGGATQRAITATLAAGYTGATATRAVSIRNDSAGTNASLLGGGNIGLYAEGFAATAGANVGVFGAAFNSTAVNVGVGGSSTDAVAGADNIGVIGQALNGGGGGATQQAGHFRLGSASAPGTGTSAALVADNGTQTDPIIDFRDNGASAMVLDDGTAAIPSSVRLITPNGAQTQILQKEVIVDFNVAAATVTVNNFFPAGCLVLSLTGRVTEAITTSAATNTLNDIGDPADADRYGAGIAGALNTTFDLTDWTTGTWAAAVAAPIYAAATNLVFDAPGAENYTDGTVRLMLHYVLAVAPTG